MHSQLSKFSWNNKDTNTDKNKIPMKPSDR